MNADPVQKVFDCRDLRHLILTKVVYAKYKEELKNNMKEFIDHIIITNWYKYCSCEECTQNRNYYNNINN
jgi:hypothetical protein